MAMRLETHEKEKLVNIFDSYLVSKTSNALSTMIGEEFTHNCTVLDNGVSKLREIKMNSDELAICTVHLTGKGDTQISILYSVKLKYAKKIAAKLLGQETVDEMDEIGKSAVSEVGNIMTGSFFNALSDGTGFEVDLSTPEFEQDEFSKIVSMKAKDISNPDDNIVVTDIEFVSSPSKIKLHMIIMQDVDNSRKVVSSNTNNASPSGSSTGVTGSEGNSDIDALIAGATESNSEIDALISGTSDGTDFNSV